jgi:hypothetical protein
MLVSEEKFHKSVETSLDAADTECPRHAHGIINRVQGKGF